MKVRCGITSVCVGQHATKHDKVGQSVVEGGGGVSVFFVLELRTSRKSSIFAKSNKKHMQRLNIYMVVIALLMLLTSCGTTDTLIADVDALINERGAIQEKYQERIDSVYSTILQDMPDVERFASYGQLYDMYRAYNIDSQLHYVQERLSLADKLGCLEYKQAAALNMAEVMMRSGMYYEAAQYMDDVVNLPLENYLRPYYFHLRRTMYGLLADFAIVEFDRQLYDSLTHIYRDSIMYVQPEGSFVYELVRADALAAEGRYIDALEVLETYDSIHAILPEDQGIFSITMAQIYRAMGDVEAEKYHLALSACSDLRRAVREYVALRELAKLLYQEGDIDHARLYMQCAIDDANAGGLRGRSMEVATIYPIIESAYQREADLRVKLLYLLNISIGLIVVFMGLFLCYYARQRSVLAILNKQLQQTNLDLEQSNQIKTVYVGRYMEMASMLIDRFDNWRKMLHQYVKNDHIKQLKTEVGSQKFTQEQLNAFYHNFDEAFLNIFPDFVDQVKELLVEGVEFRMKNGERLNTDLRVLCCIRLGITDSVQIASFLRYSLSTIYNSRTRMRNLARGDRDQFEQKIKKI